MLETVTEILPILATQETVNVDPDQISQASINRISFMRWFSFIGMLFILFVDDGDEKWEWAIMVTLGAVFVTAGGVLMERSMLEIPFSEVRWKWMPIASFAAGSIRGIAIASR